MAQSPIDNSWARPRLDLSQVLGELATALPPPRVELPVPPNAMVAMGRVLSDWRAAERLLAEHIEASPERTQICEQRDLLRAEYHRMFEERERRPEPSVHLELLRWNGLEVTAVRAS